MREPDATDGGCSSIGLYLHLPFCDHKCAYCDFNSYAGLDHLIPAYTDALVRDIGLWAEAVAGRTVTTIFFGGGTPSLTPVPQIDRILAAVHGAFDVASDVEVSLEANPGTVDEAYLRDLRLAGISRLSLGVQSFDDSELRMLDRIHDGSQAITAYRSARGAGFEDVNLDLIFGLQGQDIAGWQRNVHRAIELRPDHLSLYGLTIESGTKLAWQVGQGIAPEPDPDLQADMYEFALDAMALAGYRQYEISNWSLPGRECRHNLIYWRNQPYLGLGAGAHSRFHDARFAVVRAPAVYIQRVAGAPRGSGVASEPLSVRFPHVVTEGLLDAATDASDTAILGLRLNEGLDLQAFRIRHGAGLDDLAGPALQELRTWGLIERVDDRVHLTDRGRLLSNEVFIRLLPAELTVPEVETASR